MKLKWYGHSCFGMTFADGTTLITDPFDGSMGYPVCTARADGVLSSHGHFDHNHVESIAGNPQVVNTVGTHKVGCAEITGTASFHDPDQGAKRGSNVIFVVEADGLRIAHMGDIGHMLNETQLAALKNIDVLLIPVGGFFTIDSAQAVEIVKAINPRCAIAMHFKNEYCEFPISDPEAFLAALGGVTLPNEIEITPETELPKAAKMTFTA